MKHAFSNIIKPIGLVLIALLLFNSNTLLAKDKKKGDEEKTEKKSDAAIYSGLKWRNIGPAFTSGRIADFAVNPENKSEWYVGVASGHVWKTVNNGTTFKPIFDGQGVYSIGVVKLDPNNSNVVWVGTGENNHQRALGYGDGVYKSEDGGKSWKNMGLKDSRQIGGIVIDPRNSDVVLVAAEGSAWGPGGDRGLYKTVDGGENWEKVLEISEETGVNNVIIDPVNPDLMYATSEQRRRRAFGKIGGGPETALYKSVDGGDTWNKSTKGLPSGHVGGMGIAISPVDHNVLYVIVEAQGESGGFYRSTDRGISWSRMGDHHASGQYYNEIYCDPVDVDKVYSMETVSRVTTDAGKTWNSIGLDNRHVDDHALWVDPCNTDHMFIGGDGGVYETFDAGKTFLFKSNLPVTQFYRVNVDNDYPFYNVYGGTQDNNTLMGPYKNTSGSGVTSDEWKAILGGDGFWVAIDQENPNIVYCEYQYGNSYRYDKASGESVNIKARPRKGEDTYKWNWDAPLVASTHKVGRLYSMANKVFKSDDRGDSWEVISDDLTSGMDRNSWPMMGHYWSSDAVVKDVSTSLWGTGVSFSESPLNEDLLYAGTDDGVLSVTDNGGESWTKIQTFPGVPEYTYISDIEADKFDENTVYVTFSNLKSDDFKPYVLKSTDKGTSWVSIAANLPEDQSVHTIEQDTEVSSLLFAGTEFAFYFSLDGGKEWTKLKSGMPAIAVRDIVLQERENDIVIATFGRGFYVLEDYTPLREMATNAAIKESEAHIFEIKTAKMYAETGGKYGQGSSYYSAANPDFGAVITYYVKEAPKTLKAERKEKEKELFKEKQPIPQLTMEEKNAEESEIAPYLVFTIYDDAGNAVRRMTKGVSKGIKRITWDMQYFNPSPVRASDKFSSSSMGRGGSPAVPGTYKVSIDMVAKGEVKRLVEPVEFKAEPMNLASLPTSDYTAVAKFHAKLTRLNRTYMGMNSMLGDQSKKVITLKQAALQTPGADLALMDRITKLEDALKEIQLELYGPQAKASWEELSPMDMPLSRRINVAVYSTWGHSSAISGTAKAQYNILMEELPPLVDKLNSLDDEIMAIDKALEEAGSGWVPGRKIKM